MEKRYGMIRPTSAGNDVLINEMMEFKYEWPYPIAYMVDPVEYTDKLIK